MITEVTRPVRMLCLTVLCVAMLGNWAQTKEPSYSRKMTVLEKQFLELPMEARRLTGPLFWLHGDETAEQLENTLEKVAEGGNGCFTAESRPHIDWLGPGWYRDLRICLEKAKKLNLKMWIFDEKWWPSGEVGGEVPEQYGSRYMEATATDLQDTVQMAVPSEKLIAVLAGKAIGDCIDGESLVDLTGRVQDGRLNWQTPAGTWKVMVFTWRRSEGRRGRLLVDGASQEAVEWYVRTVYQPHYDHFSEDFGKTIQGYFYDEPETYGDWGTEVIPMLKQRGVDWKKALVAWKFQLANDDEQVAARYQYQDAQAEAWGRTFYGGLTEWCHEHHVRSIGHFLEHRREYLSPKLCGGNMVQLMKYSDMGAIDAVFKQFVPGQKDDSTYQTPKLGSSISHAYGKKDDLAMVEIFGARGQDLTYAEMKWWTDHMHVSGINFHIPHSFNPRGPYDRDCPPYFYNNGYEPRWPLYRVYADYTSRLSLMLSGGRHVCPVAFLYLGNSFHAGKAIPPEEMTTALQDALFDCDWIPYEVFEKDMGIEERCLALRNEEYRVLVVPAVETIPYETLAKVKEYYATGGIVIGYGLLPSRSATLGKTAKDILALRNAIWGAGTDEPTLDVCQTNAAAGRSYFLPEKPTSEQIRQVLTADAGVHPTLEVLDGETDDWLHVLHRVKDGQNVFFITNLQHEGPTKRFRLRARANGVPECWDSMRGEICSIPHKQLSAGTADFSLTLEPLESVLIVFRPVDRKLPVRLESGMNPLATAIEVERLALEIESPTLPEVEQKESVFAGCPWVWHSNEPDRAPPCKRFFRKVVELPENRRVTQATIRLNADNGLAFHLNGKDVGAGCYGYDNWTRPSKIDLAPHLKAGRNVLAVTVINGGDSPNPAGLIGTYSITLDDGSQIDGCIDKSWKSSSDAPTDWQSLEFDDSSWPQAREFAKYGGGAWGEFDDPRAQVTLPPVKQADPFVGRFILPDDWPTHKARTYVEMGDIPHEAAAAVKINGEYAGGFIGKPYRLNLSKWVKSGANTLEIEPFASGKVRITAYPR